MVGKAWGVGPVDTEQGRSILHHFPGYGHDGSCPYPIGSGVDDNNLDLSADSLDEEREV